MRGWLALPGLGQSEQLIDPRVHPHTSELGPQQRARGDVARGGGDRVDQRHQRRQRFEVAAVLDLRAGVSS